MPVIPLNRAAFLAAGLQQTEPQPENMCIICCETLSNNVVRLEVCGHTFHEHCISQWTCEALERNCRCPLCREWLFRARLTPGGPFPPGGMFAPGGPYAPGGQFYRAPVHSPWTNYRSGNLAIRDENDEPERLVPPRQGSWPIPPRATSLSGMAADEHDTHQIPQPLWHLHSRMANIWYPTHPQVRVPPSRTSGTSSSDFSVPPTSASNQALLGRTQTERRLLEDSLAELEADRLQVRWPSASRGHSHAHLHPQANTTERRLSESRLAAQETDTPRVRHLPYQHVQARQRGRQESETWLDGVQSRMSTLNLSPGHLTPVRSAPGLSRSRGTTTARDENVERTTFTSFPRVQPTSVREATFNLQDLTERRAQARIELRRLEDEHLRAINEYHQLVREEEKQRHRDEIEQLRRRWETDDN